MRKLTSIFLTMILFISFSVATPVKANNAPRDYGEPIEVLSYIDEEGNHITERIYFKPDVNSEGIMPFSSSGAGWYKNEKEIAWDNGLSRATYYYAEGYFEWGDGKVSVSYPDGGWDYMPSNATAYDLELTSGTGKYLGIFNNYAYVTFSFSVENVIGIVRDYSVTIRISESGNNI